MPILPGAMSIRTARQNRRATMEPDTTDLSRPELKYKAEEVAEAKRAAYEML